MPPEIPAKVQQILINWERPELTLHEPILLGLALLFQFGRDFPSADSEPKTEGSHISHVEEGKARALQPFCYGEVWKQK